MFDKPLLITGLALFAILITVFVAEIAVKWLLEKING